MSKITFPYNVMKRDIMIIVGERRLKKEI